MRSVLYVDPPAFCATLEVLLAPRLRTRPLAIAPPATDRAAVLALSPEARLAGLTIGMPVRKAQRLCPDLVVVPPNPRLYARASRALHEILRMFAPVIEPRGYGHAFLDLTGTRRLFGPPQEVAARLRREVGSRLRFPISVGIAGNKLVSQAAILADRRTGGRAEELIGNELLYVPAGNEREFLAPQPLEVLPELDSGIRSRLEDYQLELIGEVAAISESALCAVFGGEGRILRARSRGIDPRPVLSPEQQSEFHLVHTLSSDTNDLGVLHPILRLLSERLGRRLRRHGLAAGRLRLQATYADYSSVARTVPLKAALLDGELWEAAQRALALANSKRLAIRTLALTLDQLAENNVQLDLWMSGQQDGGAGGPADRRTGGEFETSEHEVSSLSRPPTRQSALQHAIDHIHSRYGAGALRRGVPLTPYRLPTIPHQTTTTFPKVALPSSTRWASAS